jgi:hypothetical protein
MLNAKLLNSLRIRGGSTYFGCIFMLRVINLEPAPHFVRENIGPEFIWHRWYFAQLRFGDRRTIKKKSE